jgi:hypothetical protein
MQGTRYPWLWGQTNWWPFPIREAVPDPSPDNVPGDRIWVFESDWQAYQFDGQGWRPFEPVPNKDPPHSIYGGVHE